MTESFVKLSIGSKVVLIPVSRWLRFGMGSCNLGSVLDNAAADSGGKTIVSVEKNINSIHDELMVHLHRQAAKLFSN